MGSFGLDRKQTWMVIVLVAGAVLVVLNQTLVTPALPTIMEHMSVDETTVQWLTSAYAMVEAVVIPLSAWFMGRLSTRQLFIGGMTLFTFGTLVAAAAPVFAILLLGRVLQAMSTGVMMAMVISTVLLIFPREKRGQAMGLVNLVVGFSPVIGPTVGGILVDTIGWRALFCVMTALALVVIILACLHLGNFDAFERAHFDVVSVVLSTLGMVSLLYGISTFASSENTVSRIVLMVVGVAILGLFVFRQTKLSRPMLRIDILRSRRYRASIVIIMLLEAAIVGCSVLMPLYVQNVLGHSATVSGLVVLPGALLGAAMALVSGRFYDRSGIRVLELVGGGLWLVGALLMCIYGMQTPLAYIVLAYLVFGGCAQMVFTPINTWGLNSLDNTMVQHATAVTNTMTQVGSSLGTALIMSFSALGMGLSVQGDALAKTNAGYHVSFVVLAVIVALIFLIIIVAVKDRKTDTVLCDDAAGSKEQVYVVGEAMDAEPLSVRSSATVSEAARLLGQTDASGVTVVDDQGNVCGFLSNSDVLRFFGDKMEYASGAASGFVALRQPDDESVRQRVKRLHDVNVMEIATKRVVSIEPGCTFEDASFILAEKRLKELPVVQDGKLVGTLHRKDLMRYIAALLDEQD